MFIVDLQCKEGHSFEGWYESTQDYYDRIANCEVTCPLCNCSEIHRRPSAVGIAQNLRQLMPTENKHHIKALSNTPMSLEIQKAISRILQKVRQTHIDVGNQFTKRALAMSRNEEPLTPIIGESSIEEESQLDEEGVPYFKIPLPDLEKN